MILESLLGKELSAWEQRTLAYIILAEIETNFDWLDEEVGQKLKFAHSELASLSKVWQRELAFEVVMRHVNQK